MRLKYSIFACLAGVALGQGVTEIRLKPEVDPPRVRPFDSLAVQVRAYGRLSKEGSDPQTVRLQRGNAKLRVVDASAGWLSKPFRFQGRDDEPFHKESTSTFADIFGMVSKDYVLQDAFLYTAPEKPGKYELEATLEGRSARLTIEVDAGAPARRKQEQHDYAAEPRAPDPYRRIAEYWSPFLAQETWFQPKSDAPARFDFDGDWDGDNNWENLDLGTSQAYVYYAAMETASHWFLIYNVFHPRDYSDKCVVGTCHENDNEGLILTVRKDGSEFGKLEVMETLAHNNVYSFAIDSRFKRGAHNVDGGIELHDGSHPVVFIESGGHGIYGSRSSHAKYDLASDRFANGTGMTFVYKGIAERPRHANDRLVGYELLPIYHHWWVRAAEDSGWKYKTFDEHYVYQPFGNRPAGSGKKIGSTFLGRKESSNKAKPFWGWHDTVTKRKSILNAGQWGLDPAYAVQKNLTFPPGEAPSLDYTYNPYLGIE
jgi:hypothetical protein